VREPIRPFGHGKRWLVIRTGQASRGRFKADFDSFDAAFARALYCARRTGVEHHVVDRTSDFQVATAKRMRDGSIRFSGWIAPDTGLLLITVNDPLPKRARV
jgi:hypothetical protein